MNLRRAGVVARKDLADALESRFLMATVVLFPFLLAVVIPVGTLFPLSTLPSRSTPLPVHVGNATYVEGANMSGGYFVNATIDRSHLTNASLDRAFIGNTTLVRAYVVDSVLWNVTLVDSVVKDSNLYRSHVDSKTSLLGSVVVGAASPLEQAAGTVLQLYLVFFLLIPVIIPAAMASYTIVGEKTNRSLEPLLASPLSSSELLFGKSVAILLPCVLATWGSFAAFSVIVSSWLDHLIGHAPVPDTTWYLAVLLVAPLLALLSIALNVVVSSRVSDVRVSQQLGSLVIVPVLLFFLGGFAGLFVLGPPAVLVMAVVVGLAAVAAFALAVRLFDREAVLLRWK